MPPLRSMTPTTRIPATAAATLAVDIGGANTKAAWLDGRRRCARSRARSRSGATARRSPRCCARSPPRWPRGPADAVAITMTAELSDAFRTKREGVAFVLDAAQDALGDRPLSVLTTAGELVSVAAARARPWDVAAANWVATALAVARGAPRRAAHRRRQHDRRHRPDRRRPRRRDRAQRPRAAAGRRARLHRRAAHQPRGDRAARAGPRRLVPGVVGVLRDQRRRPSRPRPPGAGGLRLPDARRPRRHGRVRARAHRPAGVLRRRAARRGEIDAIAAFLHGEQLRQLEEAARRVQRPLAARRARRRWSAPAPSSGARSPRASGERSPTAPWSATDGEMAPAAALAALLAARLC